MRQLEGYKCLVTGATSGIGLAISKEFIAQGATVIGVGRKFGAQTEALGESFIPCKCDLLHMEQIEAAAALAAEKFGKLDVLVNNAGVGPFIPIDDMTEKDYDDAFMLLLKAPIFMVKHCVELLAKSTNPSIINISADGALMSTPKGFLYSIPKAALVKFTYEMVGDLTGIRSNCICPGIVETPIFERSGYSDDSKKSMFDMATAMMVPAGRTARPAEVAKLCAFLASADATYINGANIAIDGGLTSAGTSKNQERVYRADPENIRTAKDMRA